MPEREFEPRDTIPGVDRGDTPYWDVRFGSKWLSGRPASMHYIMEFGECQAACRNNRKQDETEWEHWDPAKKHDDANLFGGDDEWDTGPERCLRHPGDRPIRAAGEKYLDHAMGDAYPSYSHIITKAAQAVYSIHLSAPPEGDRAHAETVQLKAAYPMQLLVRVDVRRQINSCPGRSSRSALLYFS